MHRELTDLILQNEKDRNFIKDDSLIAGLGETANWRAFREGYIEPRIRELVEKSLDVSDLGGSQEALLFKMLLARAVAGELKVLLNVVDSAIDYAQRQEVSEK